MEIENKGIRRLVQDGNMEEAIQNLDILFEDLGKERNVLATMLNRLNELKLVESKGSEPYDMIALQRNKITDSFLNFFLFLEERINNVMSIKYDIKNFDEQVRLKMMQQYHVGDKLGEGISAVIYRAKDLSTDKEYAIRALKSINATNIDEEIKGIAKAANIKHRNIIEIVSFDMDDIPYCLVMEYIHGIRLDEMLQIGAFPLRDAVKITIQLCEALYYLQNCGIEKYGRVRPSKIIIDQELQPVVSVFEIFKSKGLYQDRSKMGKELLSVRDDLRYISPEEYDSTTFEFNRDKTDQFMVGLIFYELITGNALFKGENLHDMIVHQTDFFFKEKNRKQVFDEVQAPQAVKDILEKMLSINPQERFGNIKQLSKALEKITLDTKEENDTAYESYMRCCIANKDFMSDFYTRFFGAHAEKKYQERFGSSEVNNVIKKKLQKMILQIVDFHEDRDPESLRKVLQFKGHQGLKESDYANFLKVLKETVASNDRLWASDIGIEKAWDLLIYKTLEVLK
jgi:eukaryotic-like serine/threonine-protein kinase